MNDDEKRVFIELNGYDPTTIDGVLSHVRYLERKVEIIKDNLLHDPPKEDALYADWLLALDSFEKAVSNGYETLGRMQYEVKP